MTKGIVVKEEPAKPAELTPNAAMIDVAMKRNLTSFASVEELMADLNCNGSTSDG